MKRRVLSVILALCMCMSLLPTTARAVEATSYQLYVGNVEVTSSNAQNITDDGKVSYDPETNTLTLNNATIEGGDYGIKYTGGNTLNIIGIGNSAVTGISYGIWATGDGSSLSISGTVTATASGANTTRGICASGDVTIHGDDTSVTATSGSGGDNNYGIYANNVNITGGTVSATGELCGIYAYYNLAISGGTVTASVPGESGQAMMAEGITITGCTVMVGESESNTTEWQSGDLTAYKYVKISAEGEGGGEGHSHYNCGVEDCTNGNHGHSEVTEWIELTEEDLSEGSLALEDGKSYYLGESITVTSRVEISGTVNLCLNGRSLTSAYEYGTVFIGDNATLNVTDCGSDGKIANTGSGNAIVTSISGENITLNLYKGTLESGAARAYYNGDASANCVFNQYGGKVTSAATETVAVMYGCGKYNLYGGSVENTNQNGRTVYVAGDSTQLSISGTVQLNKFIWVTNPIVIAGAITQPANAYIIKYQPASGGNTGTFTSGWNTYMASADYTKYFTPNNAAYTITKDSNGELQITRRGSTSSYRVTVENGTADKTEAAAGATVTIRADAPAEGYRFKEWTSENGVTFANANAAETTFTMPNKAVTVKATYELITYSISGTVTDDTSGTAQVTLMKGKTQIGATLTVTMSDLPNASGEYSFNGVTPGVYNVVAVKDGVTMTIMVVVTNANVTDGNITMPAGNVNSVLQVENGDNKTTPDVVVDGLQKEADVVKNAHPTADKVTVTMTVKAEVENGDDEDHTAIKNTAPAGATIEYLDITVEETVVTGSNQDTCAIYETSNVMEIVVPYIFDGKFDVTVYRKHGSEAAAALSKLNDKPASNALTDGTFWLDETNGNIYIYAQKFSTYAVGYTVTGSGGGTPGGQQSARPNRRPSSTVSYSHSCVSKCAVCGGCTDANCTEKVCAVKCKLLTMDFADVTEALWCYDEVVYVYHNSLMQGCGENEFYPDGTVTRQQVWMILARMSGADPKSMTAARIWAVENGVSDGTNPTAYVTRQQFVAMLWRYAKLQGWDVSVGEDTNILSYNDAFDVAEYAIPAMQWACGSGLMNGKDGNLMPAANTTRGQMATMFQRFCEDVKK